MLCCFWIFRPQSSRQFIIRWCWICLSGSCGQYALAYTLGDATLACSQLLEHQVAGFTIEPSPTFLPSGSQCAEMCVSVWLQIPASQLPQLPSLVQSLPQLSSLGHLSTPLQAQPYPFPTSHQDPDDNPHMQATPSPPQSSKIAGICNTFPLEQMTVDSVSVLYK